LVPVALESLVVRLDIGVNPGFKCLL
jgi:hypothetical protein